MKLNISIKFNSTFNCWQHLIYAIAQYYHKDYQLLFINSWKFHYIKTENQTIGEALYEYKYSYANDLLEELHGIKLQFHKVDEISIFINVIRKELQAKNPVIVATDTYYCPWILNRYQKLHGNHLCMIISVKDNDEFEVIDSQYAVSGEILDVYNLQKGMTQYALIKISKSDYTNANWLEIINDYNIKNYEMNTFDMIRIFGKDILQCDFRKETNGFKDIDDVPLIQGLNQISKSRKQYALALSFIYHNSNITDLNLISEKFRSIGIRWSSVLGLLLKFYYTGDEQIIIRAADIIMLLADEEEELYVLLKKVLCGERNLLKSEPFLPMQDISPKSFNMIDLSTYVNNKGFNTIIDLDCESRFTVDGKYFWIDPLTDTNILRFENMQFKTLINEMGCDNISCSNQKIKVGYKNQKYIAILGCSEYGDHSDRIKIVYEDESSQEIMMALSNWTSSVPTFNDSITLTAGIVERMPDKAQLLPFPVHLYTSIYKLESDNMIDYILLPYYPNLHIFSITLCN